MSKKSRNNTIQYDNNDYSNIVDLHWLYYSWSFNTSSTVIS
nr:hypothetical protein [Mycoplasmopsis bovis]